MTAYVSPCQDPRNDPNDWFIERDGRQYPDDTLVSLEEAEAEHAKRLADDPEATITVAEVFDDLHEAALKAALRRRRHAKDACYSCVIRTWCLGQGMQDGRRDYGTMGGYYPEERKAIQREIGKRARARRDAVGG